MDYCAQSDVYRFVPPGMLSVPARMIATGDAAANTLTLQGHGMVDDSPFTLRIEAGGSMPSPLVAGTTYYAIVVDADTFQVAASAGGSAINLTTIGLYVLFVQQIPWAGLITECSAVVDQTVIGHVVPLVNDDGTIPEPIRSYTAVLLAMRAMAFCGRDAQSLQTQLEFWSKRADKWAVGVPLRGTKVPTSANLAITKTSSQVDPRGWEARGGGKIP